MAHLTLNCITNKFGLDRLLLNSENQITALLNKFAEHHALEKVTDYIANLNVIN